MVRDNVRILQFGSIADGAIQTVWRVVLIPWLLLLSLCDFNWHVVQSICGYLYYCVDCVIVLMFLELMKWN
jgi:hypothetical protein